MTILGCAALSNPCQAMGLQHEPNEVVLQDRSASIRRSSSHASTRSMNGDSAVSAPLVSPPRIRSAIRAFNAVRAALTLSLVADTCRVRPSQSRKRVDARNRWGVTSRVVISPKVPIGSRGRPDISAHLPVAMCRRHVADQATAAPPKDESEVLGPRVYRLALAPWCADRRSLAPSARGTRRARSSSAVFQDRIHPTDPCP